MKGLSLSPDNKLLFSASSDGAIKAWSLPKALVRALTNSEVNFSLLRRTLNAFPVSILDQG